MVQSKAFALITKQQFQMLPMKTILLMKIHQKKLVLHVMTVIRINTILKEKWTSHLLIVKMKQTQFIWIMMSMLSIYIMYLSYNQITKNMYLPEHNTEKQKSNFCHESAILALLIKEPKSFEWNVYLLFLFWTKVNNNNIWIG